MNRDEVIKALVEELDEKTGFLGYDGYFDLPEQGKSFKLIIIPAPGRHTVPRHTVISAVLKVIKSHFPSECITQMDANSEYPHGSHIITISDYTRFHG